MPKDTEPVTLGLYVVQNIFEQKKKQKKYLVKMHPKWQMIQHFFREIA